MTRVVHSRWTGFGRSAPIAFVLSLGVVAALRGQGAETRGPREPLDRIIAGYTEAIRLHPKQPANYIARGDALAEKGEVRDAIADYTEAIRLDPTQANPYFRRSLAWAKNLDHRKAISDCNVAIVLESTNPAYFLARGAAWSRLGRHDPAIADLNEAIRLAPHDAGAFIARALEWEKDLQRDRAMADYQQAIVLDPKAIPAYIGRGRIWRKSGEYGNAIANFAELARVVPDNSLGHREVAWLLATCDRDAFRDGPRAVQEATTACELTSWADPRCLDTLAAACAELGDFDAAVRWQTRALEVFAAGSTKADRRLLAWKRQDAAMSQHLYRYQRRLPYRERPDQADR